MDNSPSPYGNGGGIHIDNSDATIANNIIAHNTKSGTGSYGYGVYKNGITGSVTMSHNCSYANTVSNYNNYLHPSNHFQADIGADEVQ